MHGTQEPFSLLYQNTGRNSRGSWFSQSFDVSDTNLLYLVTSGEVTVGGWWMGPDGKTSYLHDGAHFTSGSVPSWSFISKPIIQTKPSLGPASSQHALGASLQSLAQPCNAYLHTSAEISSLLGTPYFTREPAGRILIQTAWLAPFPTLPRFAAAWSWVSLCSLSFLSPRFLRAGVTHRCVTSHLAVALCFKH